MNRRSRRPEPPMSEEDRKFYAGFTNGGVLKPAPGSGINSFKQTVEAFYKHIMKVPGTETIQDLRMKTHNFLNALERALEDTENGPL